MPQMGADRQLIVLIEIPATADLAHVIQAVQEINPNLSVGEVRDRINNVLAGAEQIIVVVADETAAQVAVEKLQAAGAIAEVRALEASGPVGVMLIGIRPGSLRNTLLTALTQASGCTLAVAASILTQVRRSPPRPQRVVIQDGQQTRLRDAGWKLG